jgi:hypothetical protein
MRRKDGQLDRRTTAYRQEVEKREASKEAVLLAVLVGIASIVTLLGSLWSRLFRRSKDEGSANSSQGQVSSQHPSRPRWRVWLVRGGALCLFSFACMTAAVIVEPTRGAESSGSSAVSRREPSGPQTIAGQALVAASTISCMLVPVAFAMVLVSLVRRQSAVAPPRIPVEPPGSMVRGSMAGDALDRDSIEPHVHACDEVSPPTADEFEPLEASGDLGVVDLFDVVEDAPETSMDPGVGTRLPTDSMDLAFAGQSKVATFREAIRSRLGVRVRVHVGLSPGQFAADDATLASIRSGSVGQVRMRATVGTAMAVGDFERAIEQGFGFKVHVRTSGDARADREHRLFEVS